MKFVWCVFDVDNDGRNLLCIYPTMEKAIHGCEASGIELDKYIKIEEWEVVDA